jgi:dihydrofolate synthase/folylpolyglutamate synthase
MIENILKKYRQKYNLRTHTGLDRIKYILSKLDNPQNKYLSIHIAGTNGKGSVSSMLNQTCVDLDLNVGIFTSPHLERFTERIKVNNNEILDNTFIEIFESKVKPIIEKLDKDKYGNPTEFEVIFIVALEYFSQLNIDIAIIEAGLGGRIDATNVLENILVSIITSVSIDHVDRLGDTLEKITSEKVGIIKEDIPVISTILNSHHHLYKNKTKLISFSDPQKFIIQNKKIDYITIDKKDGYIYNGMTTKCIDDKSIFYNSEIFLPFLAEYQLENLSIVINALDKIFELKIKLEKIKDISKIDFVDKSVQSISKTKWGGRFEFIFYNGLTTILDGSHNEEGLKELVYNLKLIKGKKTIISVFACNKNKDYEKMLKKLSIVSDYFILTKSHVTIKAQDIEPMSKFLELENKNHIIVKDYRLINKGISKIVNDNLISKNDYIINICGSLYLVGAIRDIINNQLGGHY